MNKLQESIQQQYYKIPEEDVQRLISRAKRGHNGSQEKLLWEFRNYLNRYVTLLYHVRYDPNNYDIRKFIALYIPEPSLRYHLRRGSLNQSGVAMVSKTLYDINFMITRYCDEEDVRQTVSMTFLQCVNKYKRSRSKRNSEEWVPFSGYVYSYFYYMLKKNVDHFLIDQLGLKTFPLITDINEESEDEIAPGFQAPAGPTVEEMIGPEILNDNWVLGDTAFPPFDGLSINERQMLKWRYVDGLKASEIARKVTEHPNTVRENLNRIKDKLIDDFRESTF